MSGQIIEAGGALWRFTPDRAPPAAGRVQVLARAQLIDEITGLPPRLPLSVSTRTPGVAAQAAPDGGLAGLVGRPLALFPNPWPAADPRLHLRIHGAPRLLPLELEAPLPATPGYPEAFAPLDFGTVALRRAPTAIAGRVVSRASGAPVAGATVVPVEGWERLADLGGGPGSPPVGLALPAGLYADRPAGSVLLRRSLTPQLPAKRLLRAARPGETRLRLSDRQGLLAGRPLALGFEDPETAEFILLAGIDPAGGPDQAGFVTLAHPLRRAHPAGAPAAATAQGAPGPGNATTRAARAGDASLFAATLAGFTAASRHLVISGGGAPAEIHAYAPWRATTGPDGFFRLPPLHRLAHLRLRATTAGPAQQAEALVTLGGEAPEAFVELRLP